MQSTALGFPNTPESLPCNSSSDEGRPRSTPQTKARRLGITALHSNSPWHQDQARCFLQNLNNFIPLGCLVGKPAATSNADAAEWTEIFQIPDGAGLQDWRLDLEEFISAGWIRVFITSNVSPSSPIVLRIHILAADTGHRFIRRYDKAARTRYVPWRLLIEAVDTSPQTWQGNATDRRHEAFDTWAAADKESLFWMFNNIPSPDPNPAQVDDMFRKQALIEMLDSTSNPRGMQTTLYPYQRRSAGLMLQRESESRLYLDPRFEMRTSPDGSKYYYNPRDFTFHRQPRRYEAGKGGILAETMGLGKTVMTLALIVSTRGFLPRVPVEHSQTKPRPITGTLTDMCIAAAQRHAIPWRNLLDDNQKEAETVKKLDEAAFTYEIPQIPVRFNRTTTMPPPKIKTMAATTIVVVPRNICSQWQSEIEKHLEPGALEVLVMDDLKKELPPADDLRQFDLILFSRNRFEQESRDGSDEQGRRFSKTPRACACPYIGATRTRDCTCLRTDDLYSSPLKKLHFLRIIIDEGHSFSSTTSLAALVAEKLVTADHRWVVSGTPAKDLLGVEMDAISSELDVDDMTEEQHRAALLDQRKDFDAKEDTQGAVKNLGSLISHFLQIKPWCGGQGEQPAMWEEYIYRHEDPRRKTYTAFSKALRQTLDAVVIKTRPEDVERDIELPPLVHETIKLEPSFYDKVTANLFTLVLTSNAVTSERTDRDYLFHKESAKARYELISNLRKSTFFWTGFSEADVVAAIETGTRYLEKEDTKCSAEDRTFLQECIAKARSIFESSGWKGMSATHELGLFAKDWPQESADNWTMEGTNPMLTGATQISDAQDYINSNIGLDDVGSNLTGEAIKAMVRANARGRQETETAKGSSKSALVKTGVPSSSVKGEPTKKRDASNKRSRPDVELLDSAPAKKKRRTSNPSLLQPSASPTSPTIPAGPPPTLPPSSPLLETSLVGTASAKTSHLLSEILAHHHDEKILIFYTSDNSAFYLSQCLDILHISHLIYARALNAATKSKWLVQFNNSPTDRVMLMDVAQAAFGLNLSAASRVYFINPVCRPGVEAQAVKRAHRIGQKREVRVQTLILRGTVEEGMWERSRRMSRDEHRSVRMLEDDEGVRGVVQGAKLLDLGDGGDGGWEKVALLGREERIFARQGWEEWGEGKWRKRCERGRREREREKEGRVEVMGRATIDAAASRKVMVGVEPAIKDVQTNKRKRRRKRAGDDGAEPEGPKAEAGKRNMEHKREVNISESPKREVVIEIPVLEMPMKKKKTVGFAIDDPVVGGSSTEKAFVAEGRTVVEADE
ncbi:F-box protein [Sphaceloma murrayae]|uniref:F-box protein n=1 Tax=Sphaceloma murrayae TaxID=2082308 RepID=A0A2K1QP71_9PEZI|nr:F-box protein [Sphaceloma murrayae]